MDLVLFCPSFFAFCTVTILPSSRFTVHLPDGLGALLSFLLCLLYGDYLAILEVHNGGHFTTIRSCLVKLFSKLELELHSLEGGGRLNSPDSSLLSHLHHWGGDSCGLPQKEVNVEGLEKLLVLLRAGSLVLALECVHCSYEALDLL